MCQNSGTAARTEPRGKFIAWSTNMKNKQIHNNSAQY